jgi:hypothetical protein
MEKLPSNNPKQLRDMAERAYRLASETRDVSVHDALTLYGQELLAHAEKLEAEGETSERYAG